MTDNPFVPFVQAYRDNRVAFVERVLKAKPFPWQRAVLEALDRGERRISVRSGHGVGKTTLLAWAINHFLVTRGDCKVAATAPSSAQMEGALVPETVKWLRALPEALQGLLTATTDRIYLTAAPELSFATFRTAREDRPEALAGIHAGEVLLICDEASGIPESIFESAAGSMSGHHATTILTGNPVRDRGFFYRTHNELRDSWFTLKVASTEVPIVAEDFVQQIRDSYGLDSNAYRVRVLGEFPASGFETLIGRDLVLSAQRREIVTPVRQPVWGVDPARFGADRTGFCVRYGPVVTEVQGWNQLDTMATVGRLKGLYDATPEGSKPREILVDVIGIGAGVVDRLRELGLPVRGVNVAEAPALVSSSAYRLRDELWLELKHWLERRDCRLPEDEDLLEDITAPGYSFISNGKLKVEGKDEMRKRGQRSPDLADALCMTFAGEAATASGAPGTGWSRPLRRGVPVV